MPSKYQIISELAAQKALEITSSPETYRSFLATAANNYKYDFREQLLIYAQKPDATACAQIEVWNRLGRWVNKGTKGIALLVEDGSQYQLRHVFDVSDTNSRSKSYVNLWRMRETDIPQVEEALRNSFGDFGKQPNFAGSVVAAATIVVDDNLTDYMEQMVSVISGNPDIQGDTITGFRDMLRVSVSYMVLARSGMEPDRVFTPEVFQGILAYQSLNAISILGQAASDMAEMILREIERTVKALDREDPGRTFANQSPVPHNEGEINDERSTDYGTDLQTGGGLQRQVSACRRGCRSNGNRNSGGTRGCFGADPRRNGH